MELNLGLMNDDLRDSNPGDQNPSQPLVPTSEPLGKNVDRYAR